MDDELTVQSARKNFSTEELLRLLAHFEGEIQARDIVIAALKSEKAKQLLHEAKYGQLAGSDPVKALQRDSSFMDEGNEVDESSIGHMYETQLMQLERLITVQRRCHNRSKQILAATEKRHARILRELDEEKRRSAADAAQGDDLCVLLENERTRLRQQVYLAYSELEYEQKEGEKAHKEVERLEKKLRNEQERHKSMVLFLVNERKQMLFEVHELKVQNGRGPSCTQEAALLAEMRKEVTNLRSERDQLRTALDAALSEVQTLKEVARNQEEDLALMRSNILVNTRNYANNLRFPDDGSVVVANKGVSNISSPSKNSAQGLPPGISDLKQPVRPRLATSSTFPASNRIPQSRVPLRAPPPLIASSIVPLPPSKKGPPRPMTLSAVRSGNHSSPRDRERMSSSSDSSERIKNTYSVEPEIEHLGAVIESMNTNKRSASLPRNGKNGVIVGSHVRKPIPSKAVATAKRSTIFKALGVTTRNDRNGT
uniref:Cortactin-binding protein-2 N-terminal domain-containing protein n=1 Tax=Setaria digitata TaxID=48799 RepID=A0A915PZ45_9BILA